MRILRLAGLLLVLAALGLPAAEEHSGSKESRLLLYRAVNFALLAAGLGYLIKKNAGPFFAARSEAIRSGIAEAQKLLQQSEQRAAAIEERLARLSREIADLRSAARAEIVAEHARIEREAEQAVHKVFLHLAQEMAAAAKAARMELRSYAASLAVGLAAKKIAGRVTSQIHDALLGSFLRGLGGSPPGGPVA